MPNSKVWCVCVCVNCKGPSADLDSVSGRPTAPSLACAATRAGSKLRLPETTSQASLGDIRFSHAHHGMGPNCTQAISDVCRGGGDGGVSKVRVESKGPER